MIIMNPQTDVLELCRGSAPAVCARIRVHVTAHYVLLNAATLHSRELTQWEDRGHLHANMKCFNKKSKNNLPSRKEKERKKMLKPPPRLKNT